MFKEERRAKSNDLENKGSMACVKFRVNFRMAKALVMTGDGREKTGKVSQILRTLRVLLRSSDFI